MKVYRSFGSSSIGRFVLPLLLLQQCFERAFVASKSSGTHYKTIPLTGGYELVCRKHEILQCTVPCCEPTCDNDCSKASCPVEIVRRKTCVCEPGYVRHKGKCIHPSRCPPKPPAPCECGPNEELLPSPPSCEPTCTDDCSSTVYHTRYVDQPTCVCRKGYRRHNGKCIRVDQCPTCGPYATLRPHAPCCEPTCINDCSNVICISESYGEPACVCQDGYVKHNATCIRKETCPNHKPTSYLTYAPETVTESPNVVYSSHPASSYRNEHSDHYAEYHTSHSAGCNCHRNPCPHTISIANQQKPAVYCPTPGLGHPIRPTVAPCEKHTPKPHYPESTYNNQAKDPHVLSPYQSVPLYTVTTPPPTTTPVTVAYTQSPQYEHPFYHHGDQVVNVPYQYVPHQYKSTVNEVHKDQCYLPLPATISQVPEPVDVVYRQPPSPPCFSYRL
uniref:EGF-like domain-containing protein n=1 Tax=Anopheles albimanus TaxID=7167 RepID=A0A182FXW8_ANOAL